MADPGHADAEDLWEDQPRRAASSSAPVLSVEGFKGPLDFLLEMARAQKIDLARLSIVALVDAFAKALEAAFAVPGALADLARWGDWLVMAANLTLLRSRLLLPADAPQVRAARDEAETLRLALLGREEMQAAADWLDGRTQLGRDVFVRGQPERRAVQRGGDLTELLRACLALLHVPAAAVESYELQVLPFWRVSDAMARIREVVEESGGEIAMAALLPVIAADVTSRERRCRAAVASTLFASLELARTGLLELMQPEAWAPIVVTRSTMPTQVS